MILNGNQRGGAKDLALHLLKDENEHVEIYELRGFVSDNLVSALNESYAISRATQCKQFLYSLSLNPPPSENVDTESFERAIDQVEEKLGLVNQPRAIVFHEKEGRRHAHAVWSRIDADEMKAIPLPYTKLKLKDVSRELFLEHGWQMPPRLMKSQKRDPRNFTLAEWQQAKRTKKEPRELKTIFQDCWAVSDTQATFAHALKERGYILARGDKRGFVALDHRGEPFSISKWVGIRAKEVRAKLKDGQSLPSVEEAREQIARGLSSRLTELQNQQRAAFDFRMTAMQEKLRAMAQKHATERKEQSEFLERRWRTETAARQKRFNTGLQGLFDRLTGNRRRIREQNEREACQALIRDRREKDNLIFLQLEERRMVQARIENFKTLGREQVRDLNGDIRQFHEMLTRSREKFVLDWRDDERLAPTRRRSRGLDLLR